MNTGGQHQGSRSRSPSTTSGSGRVRGQEINHAAFAPQCPDTLDPRDTCVLNPLREPFAKKECSVLLSEVFETCHPVVSGCRALLLLRSPLPHRHLPGVPSALKPSAVP